MELSNAKGVSDIPPEKKIIKQKIIDQIKEIFERFGYSPLETPIIERYDILASKYAGGSEILKETFKLTDQGGRDLCLRYDLTVPMCRFVGMNKTLKYPFKRYQIGEVFRDGPIKVGRLREFWQCDVDIVGTKSMMADAEFVVIARQVFNKLGLDVNILVNNRKILNGMLTYSGINKEEQENVILTIDKLAKIGVEGVREELIEKQVSTDSTNQILEILFNNKGSNSEKLDYLFGILEDEGKEGIEEMRELLGFAEANFDFSLARGLSYYTGTVYEVYLKDLEIFNSAIAAGGRYDKMIGNFLESSEVIPAIGISFGLEPISVVMENKEKVKKTVTEYYLIPINTEKETFMLAQELREKGLRVDMDFKKRGVSKNLDYANSYGIPYVVFVGKQELEQGKLKLRNMETGEEKLVTKKELGERS